MLIFVGKVMEDLAGTESFWVPGDVLTQLSGESETSEGQSCSHDFLRGTLAGHAGAAGAGVPGPWPDEESGKAKADMVHGPRLLSEVAGAGAGSGHEAHVSGSWKRCAACAQSDEALLPTLLLMLRRPRPKDAFHAAGPRRSSKIPRRGRPRPQNPVLAEGLTIAGALCTKVELEADGEFSH